MSDPGIDRDPFEVVAESFLARLRAGERPSVDEYVSRHPELADQIRELLPALVLIERDLVIDSNLDTEQQTLLSASGNEQRLGDYRILREIGRGGMGVVYEAEQISLGRRVALKVLPSRAAGDRQALERFRREAKAAAGLHHTNIVPVFEVGHEGDLAFYAMQLIQGQPLNEIIDELARLRERSSKTRMNGFTSKEMPADDTPARSSASAGNQKRELGVMAESILSGQLMTEGPPSSPAEAFESFGRGGTERP